MTEGDFTAETKAAALHVYREEISPLDVTRAYLQIELENIFGKNLRSDKGFIHESFDDLDELEMYRLLEAASHTYRMNGVFHRVTDQSFDWTDVELPIDAIKLTEIKPRVNEIVYSPSINRSPVVFAAYLDEYFTEHPNLDDDPKQLNEFRVRRRKKNSPIITTEKDGIIEAFDGNHRLVNVALLGKASIRAFAGIPNGQEPLGMMGDSIFLTLKLQYDKTTSPEERAHILATRDLLARTSIDGPAALQRYW